MIADAIQSNQSVAIQIHAVAQAAYALEAERIACADFPPLHESLDDVRRSSDSFLVFEQAGRIVAALSFDRVADPVTITRLIVSPAHLRQGIATALLAALERRLPPMAPIAVSTAQFNTPAVALYQQAGYAPDGVTMSVEGIPLLHLTKNNRQQAEASRQTVQ